MTMNNQTNGKIKISSKEVIEQKAALQMILNKFFDGKLYNEGLFDWLVTPKNPRGFIRKLLMIYMHIDKWKDLPNSVKG